MVFVEAASASRIAPGTMHAAEAGGVKLLIANVDGAFYAMRRTCPHMGADLSKGRLDGAVVRCRMHGVAFDVTTGKPIFEPEVQHLKMLVREPTSFSVELRGDKVMIAL